MTRAFEDRLIIPAIAAPMFRTSGPDLVVEACKHGMIGAFPSINPRSCAALDNWLVEIKQRLAAFEAESDKRVAPYAVNLIVHRTNVRYADALETCLRHEVPLVITSLGAVPDLVKRVHQYGGIVYHDVTTVRHARKAAESGVDGLVLVCAGAGGHAGTLSPLAFIPEVRNFFAGAIALAGCISSGSQVLAAAALGADLAYLGTRFLATKEATCSDDIKAMILSSHAEDIIYTAEFSGVAANYLLASIVAAGFDPSHVSVAPDELLSNDSELRRKARKTVWSAGQGCGSISEIMTVAELCQKLTREYYQSGSSLSLEYFRRTQTENLALNSATVSSSERMKNRQSVIPPSTWNTCPVM